LDGRVSVAATRPDPAETIRSKPFLVLLALAAIVGLAVSFASWGFLELVHQIQQGVFTHLPSDLGYSHGAPLWWSLPVCGLGGLLVAVAVVLLPGEGGHVPADGLKTGTTEPSWLPGIVLAALATLGLGLVLGPEAPLIAIGGGLGILFIRLVRRGAPNEVQLVVSAAGAFAALSMIFNSPLIAAMILIEATGLGGPQLRLVLLPGLLAAGIGSLISIGMGSWTGLSTSAYSLGALSLPAFPRPAAADFGWTIALAVAVAIVGHAIVRFGRGSHRVVGVQPFLLLPAAGLAVGGLAIAFSKSTGKGVNQVLFSGQDALGPLVTHATTWSLSALALLIVFKGLAWGVSLGSFRGGPTFPALFLGAAAGLMASHLPGFSLTPGVAVGMATAVVAVLKLPLAAVVIGVVLTSKAGAGASPLIIVGVVVAYVATVVTEHAVDRLVASRRPR
jgi:H+/Cl- antiporter ClcA